MSIVQGAYKVPEKTLILGENRYYSKNGYKTKLNNNVLVVGASGAGKTRSIVIPNILQADGSYVVSDPKGNLVKKLGPYLKSNGYNVLTIDFIHPEKSSHYNPLGYCRSQFDIQKLASILVNEKRSLNTHADPFWDLSTMLLLESLIAYVIESDEFSAEEKNLSTVLRLICENKKYTDANGNEYSKLDIRMNEHKENYYDKFEKESWAYEKYEEVNTAPKRTFNTINITSISKLSSFDTPEVRRMIRENDIDFRSIGKEPTALFVIVSDTDRSMDTLINVFYTQLINELCTYADESRESKLKVPVQFILDDFATNAKIDNFQNMISNIRSRGISTILMLQSEAQLKAFYGQDAVTIVDNCNTYVYMGGSNPEMAEIIGKRANKTPTTILNMPLSKSWIFRRGEEPVFCDNFNLELFEQEKGLCKIDETEQLTEI